MIKTIKISSGIKRLINIATGRDVLIAKEGTQWLMIANAFQPDAHQKLGWFQTVEDCKNAIA